MTNYATPVYGPVQASRSGRGRKAAIWILAILTGLFFLTSVFLFIMLTVAVVGLGAASEISTDRSYRERVVMGEGLDKVLLVQISGVIMDYESFGLFGETRDTVEVVRKSLDRATEDGLVKAVLLEVNSPGGGITASDTVHQAIARFKSETGKPVVAYFGDVAASGGYYVSAAADSIVANPTTITGSIGVVMGLVNIEQLFQKIGVQEVTMKSAPLKDMGSSTRAMTDEERQIFEGILQEMHQRFVRVVGEGRKKLSQEEVEKLADGRVYTGEQALQIGLVDQLGYREDAFEKAKELAGIKEAKLVRYEPFMGLLRLLSGYSQSRRLPLGLPLKLPGEMELPMYLWSPGS